MFQQQSGPGDPRHPLGGAQRAEGNRPAHNARKATPGSVLSRGAFQGKQDAGDFLGLEQELAAGSQGSAPHELLAHDVSKEDERGEEGQSSSWLMESDDQELIHIVDEEGDQDSAQVETREPDDLRPPEEPPIVSWREPEARSSSRRLVGVAAGIIVVGMLGAAGYKLVGLSSTSPAAEPVPLAAQGNPLPRAIESMSAPKVDATDAAADLERLSFDPGGQATAQPPRTDFSAPPSDPRAAFEAARGDEAPVWFDPQQHAAEQAGSQGYEEPQDAMLQSSAEGTPVEPAQPLVEVPSPVAGGDAVLEGSADAPVAVEVEPQDIGAEVAQTETIGPGLMPLSEYLELMRKSQAEAAGESSLGPAGVPHSGEVALAPVTGEPTPDAASRTTVVDSGAAAAASEVPADSLAQAEGPTATLPAQGSEVAEPATLGDEPAAAGTPEIVPTDPATSPDSRAHTLLAETPPPSGDPIGAAPAPGALPSLPVDALVGPGPVAVAADPQPPSVSEVGPLPLPADPRMEDSAAQVSEVARFLESRQGRTSTLKIEDVLLAPTLDAGNLRQATSKDLSGIWDQTSVPLEHMDHKTKVLTPNVGRVRVVLKTKDIFEGSLYAVGEGSLWLDTQYGRMGLAGMRVDRVEQLDTPADAPALGAPGSQSFAGMARVRVKTPGGVFYGKVISRDDQTTTLITDDGARITILSKDVELLVDAPKVAIKEDQSGAKKP